MSSALWTLLASQLCFSNNPCWRKEFCLVNSASIIIMPRQRALAFKALHSSRSLVFFCCLFIFHWGIDPQQQSLPFCCHLLQLLLCPSHIIYLPLSSPCFPWCSESVISIISLLATVSNHPALLYLCFIHRWFSQLSPCSPIADITAGAWDDRRSHILDHCVGCQSPSSPPVLFQAIPKHSLKCMVPVFMRLEDSRVLLDR